MTLAILCSGQGQGHDAAFALTGAAPEAAGLFARAASLLGADPRRAVADPDLRHRNRTAQVVCTLQALAAASLLGSALPGRPCVAGYSVGELAAWGVAGLIAPEDVLDLAARRADLMDAATRPGDGLVFVRGLSPDRVEALCAARGGALAIRNPGDAVVLGGSAEFLDAVEGDARGAGAIRVVRLPVAVASHTPRLAGAAAGFAEVLRARPVPPRPAGRLFSGVDGLAVTDPRAGLDKLAAQIARTVQWAACLEGCVEAGATGFLELGPGRALAEMAGSAHPALPARSLEDFRTADGLRAWVRRFA